jgi:hypothetical protein
MVFIGNLGREIELADSHIEIRVTSFIEKGIGVPSVKIELKNITSIELKKEDILKKGFIHFIVSGSGFERDSLKGIKANYNPYLIHFADKKYGDAVKFIETVNNKLSEYNVAPKENKGDMSTDVLGQLEKLSALKNAGILTEEEFSTKKAELLSRL